MKTALFAWPAGHSLSPPMHNAAFAELGIGATYEARGVPPKHLTRALAELRSGEWLGVNLSIPHKVAALAHVDEMSPAAQAIGAINTVAVQNGRLCGFNTDADGFYAGLQELGPLPAQRSALVLGAGGAARAVCYALLSRGTPVHLVNRTHSTAVELAEQFRAYGTIIASDIHAVPLQQVGVLVNTTAVGMHGGPAPNELPLPRAVLAQLPRSAMISDLVYRPATTPLLAVARELGFTHTQNGLAMLLHQGALAFTHFTGREAPKEAMKTALQGALGVQATE